MSTRRKKTPLLQACKLEQGLAAYANTKDKTGIELEIGCGDGRFLPWLSEQAPDHMVLGIEKEYEWAQKAARRVRTLDNAEVLCYDAGWLLRQLTGRGTVWAVWMNFPDPWPKLRHAQRRLAGQLFFGRLAGLMERHGHYHLATDVKEYADLVRGLLNESPHWELLAHSPRADAGVQTRFESKWIAMGRPCYYLSAKLTTPLLTEPVPLAEPSLAEALADHEKIIRVHGTEIRRNHLVARFLGPFKDGRAQVAVACTDEPGHLLAKLETIGKTWNWINRNEWIATTREVQLLVDLLVDDR